MRRALPAACTLALAALAAGAAPARASFPGADGLIAYSSAPEFVGDSTAIYTIRPDGTGRRRLTAAGAARNPAWSANGRMIAFDHVPRGGGLRHVRVMRADGGRQRAVMKNIQSHNPAWAPDGRRLVFQGCGRSRTCERDSIFVVRRNGRGLKRLGAVGADPVWSPNGRWIAYAGRLSEGGCTVLILVRPSGKGRHAIGPSRRDDQGVCPSAAGSDFAPDSRRLVYYALRPTGTTLLYDHAMYTIGIDGRNRRLVTSRSSGDGGFFLLPFVWSPEGGRLLWRDDSGTYVGRTTGGGAKRVPRAQGAEYAWQPLTN